MGELSLLVFVLLRKTELTAERSLSWAPWTGLWWVSSSWTCFLGSSSKEALASNFCMFWLERMPTTVGSVGRHGGCLLLPSLSSYTLSSPLRSLIQARQATAMPGVPGEPSISRCYIL